MMTEKTYQNGSILIKYREIENNKPPLVMIHAQGVDSSSFQNVAKTLARKYHVFSVDCYGHGGSLHDPEKYNIVDISDAIAAFISDMAGGSAAVLGHSSGGLIAARIAAEIDLVNYLILEDPPFFVCQGERRFKTYNYIDLSSVCHRYIATDSQDDFPVYYFENQCAWDFFPEKSREKVRPKLTNMARKYRTKHPDKDLKVPFWPKSALAAFQGMNDYDPRFGEAFFSDSFHCGIPHEDMLKKIRCRTLFMKAKTAINDEGILMAALSDEDVERVQRLIPNCRTVRFDCGHAIHLEKPSLFVKCVMDDGGFA